MSDLSKKASMIRLLTKVVADQIADTLSNNTTIDNDLTSNCPQTFLIIARLHVPAVQPLFCVYVSICICVNH